MQLIPAVSEMRKISCETIYVRNVLVQNLYVKQLFAAQADTYWSMMSKVEDLQYVKTCGLFRCHLISGGCSKNQVMFEA